MNILGLISQLIGIKTLRLTAIITKGYFLGLTQDVDHFDLGFFVIRIGDFEYW